ncbi:MAG TPA: hypothetical protein VHP14_08040 [Anaerolineales bacterium]|nr:hypothetical protein [Anaerolineales bacterium]
MPIRDYPKSDTQLDRDVLVWLKHHVGKQNAIGRWELVQRIFGEEAARVQSDENQYDRQIRDAVVRLRRSGLLICDMGDGRGRYVAATLEEYQAFRKYYGAGAFDRLTTIREMDNAAKEAWPGSDPLQEKLL